MKNIFLLILFLYPYQWLTSQTFQDVKFFQQHRKENPLLSDTIGTHPNHYMDQIWVMDSSISYSRIQDEMIPGSKRTVLNRNEAGELRSELWQFFDSYSQLWKNRFLKEVKYYTPGQPEKEATYPWIQAENKWNEEPAGLNMFDEKGNLTELLNRTVNFEGNYFTDGYRDLYEYDENNNKTKAIYQNWNVPEQDWKNEVRFQNEYDLNNNLILIKRSEWDGVQWRENLKVTKTYDENGMLNSSLEQIWDNLNNEWVKTFLYTYSYYDSGENVEELKQEWGGDNESWINNSLIKREYNSYGSVIQEIKQYWNNDSLKWINNKWQLFEYTDDDKMLLDVFKKWNDGQWETRHRYEYIYDQNGNLIQYLEKEYYIPEDSLQNSNREIFSYDEDNNLTEELSQAWNYDTGVWINLSLSENTFDEHDNLTRILFQIWEDNSWQSYQRFDNYWSLFTFNHVNEQKGNSIKIVPNPVASGFEIVSGDYPGEAEISIYDENGRFIKHLSALAGQRIDISDLKKGVYLITIKTFKRTFQTRLIKI